LPVSLNWVSLLSFNPRSGSDMAVGYLRRSCHIAAKLRRKRSLRFRFARGSTLAPRRGLTFSVRKLTIEFTAPQFSAPRMRKSSRKHLTPPRNSQLLNRRRDAAEQLGWHDDRSSDLGVTRRMPDGAAVNIRPFLGAPPRSQPSTVRTSLLEARRIHGH
jgi:hypothetical protein